MQDIPEDQVQVRLFQVDINAGLVVIKYGVRAGLKQDEGDGMRTSSAQSPQCVLKHKVGIMIDLQMKIFKLIWLTNSNYYHDQHKLVLFP